MFISTFISASEPFAVNRTSLNNAVNQETSNILNRNNSSSEKENHDEPPSEPPENFLCCLQFYSKSEAH